MFSFMLNTYNPLYDVSPLTIALLKFRRFTPEFLPNFSYASFGAQLRTIGNTPKFQWNFRSEEICLLVSGETLIVLEIGRVQKIPQVYVIDT